MLARMLCKGGVPLYFKTSHLPGPLYYNLIENGDKYVVYRRYSAHSEVEVLKSAELHL